MTAGAWFDWTTGDLVTEARFQDIQDSIVFIYADDTAANAALTNKVEGTTYFNTTDDVLKFWDGSAWVAVSGVNAFQLDFVIIGGGGGSAGTTGGYAGGGGGGAGGYLASYLSESSGGGDSSLNSLTILADGTTQYRVTVGAGGSAGSASNLANNGKPGIGSTSEFILIASGGGSSGHYRLFPRYGSSGGGTGTWQNSDYDRIGTGISNQGFDGGAGNSHAGNTGDSAGGGGGAGSAGEDADTDGAGHGGDGGSGVASTITGSSVSRAGGGGGCGGTSTGTGADGGGNGALNANGNAGTANTGGGAGGSSGTGSYTGGAGGSGVVILRWATADATIGATRTGLTDGGVQTDGTGSYIVFTAGTGNITFS